MDLGLRNKIAIVTGASEGLGFAAARSLADEGASVVICSRRKKKIIDAAREIERVTHGTVFPLVADISKPSDVKKVVKTATKEFGSVHVLVNNTGGPPVADFEKLTDAQWQSAINLILMSMIRFIREVLPFMKKQSWGRIITITSIAAKQPVDDLVTSSTIRPGIHALTKILSNQYAGMNILFNTVCPGFILTKRQEEILGTRAAQEGISISDQIEKITHIVPVKRMGTPEEVGDVIAFLASEKASFITGEALLVDGGLGRAIP